MLEVIEYIRSQVNVYDMRIQDIYVIKVVILLPSSLKSL